MTTGFIFTEAHNRKNKTDGDEFKMQANALLRHWESDDDLVRAELMSFKKVPKQKKKAEIMRQIGRASSLSRLAFFCHGWPTGISLGFKSKDVPELARAIAAACQSNVVHIGLYACLTGRGAFLGGAKRKKNMDNRAEKVVTAKEGFAMYLCSQLDELGIHAVITAHLTSGHTTRNPYKVRIEKEGSHYKKIRMCPLNPRAQWRQWIKKLESDPIFPFQLLRMGRHLWHR